MLTITTSALDDAGVAGDIKEKIDLRNPDAESTKTPGSYIFTHNKRLR